MDKIYLDQGQSENNIYPTACAESFALTVSNIKAFQRSSALILKLFTYLTVAGEELGQVKGV